MTGSKIAQFEIHEQLGEGGMGVVYKARDTHLDRFVAIKVLKPEKVTSLDRKRRFVQEAKSASALNHPNIVHIYDINQYDGVDYIAMEFVAGKTLGELIPRKGMRLGEVLKYAIQVADALATAHEAGIVHRDLKPGNVMVTEKGQAKVLDFGLAKLTEPEKSEAGEFTATSTISEQLTTERGAILGTVAYLSPEQVRGKRVDARSDIFSFGLLLYELIAGTRPFERDDRISTLAAVLNEEPTPLSRFSPKVPVDLERLVARCLRKDPRRRVQVIDDVRLMLEDLLAECGAGVSGTAPVVTKPAAIPWRSPKLLAMFVAVGGLAGLLTWWAAGTREPTAGSLFDARLTRLTKDSSHAMTPAMSPDGQLVAYASDRAGEEGLDIWVQHISGGGTVRLTTHEAAEYSPVFSPDGARIAYRSDSEGGGIYVVPVLGGDSRLIASGGRRPRFSPDGSLIAYYFGPPASFSGTRIYLVSSAGGRPERLQSEFSAAASPIWTPDGKHLLFLGTHPTEGWDWWVTSIDGGTPVRVGVSEIFERQELAGGPPGPEGWLDGNYVVFTAAQGDSTNLWRIPISPGSWRVRGPAQRITFGAGELQASVAPGGRLVFTSGSNNTDIWSLPIEANRARLAGELQRLTTSASLDFSCDISADGTRLAFRSDRSDAIDLWVQDRETGRERALTSGPEFESLPKISADGSEVAYGLRLAADGSGPSQWAIRVQPAGGGLAETVCEDCGPPMSWSSDRSRIVYVRATPAGAALFVFDRTTGQSQLLAEHPELGVVNAAKLSPDDAWLACKGDLDTRRSVVFVIPLRDWSAPPAEEWIRITEGESWDDVPRWSPDGNVVYFVSNRDGFRCLWARRLDPATKRPLGPPFAVRHFHQARLSVVGNLALIELAVARDKVVLPLNEMAGSVWLAEPPR